MTLQLSNSNSAVEPYLYYTETRIDEPPFSARIYKYTFLKYLGAFQPRLPQVAKVDIFVIPMVNYHEDSNHVHLQANNPTLDVQIHYKFPAPRESQLYTANIKAPPHTEQEIKSSSHFNSHAPNTMRPQLPKICCPTPFPKAQTSQYSFPPLSQTVTPTQLTGIRNLPITTKQTLIDFPEPSPAPFKT